MISDDQLRQVMPNLPAAKRALYLPHLNAAMQSCGITTPLRTAAFVAQLAHESGEFRWMEEIWGPTPAQQRYEPPSDLAARLGNTQTGDGKRFKGRGPIQITGRFNYAKFGGLLGIDLVGNPAQAAAPEVAFATAGLFWQKNGLNELADVRDFLTITRRINGGTNGLADRQMYYERAKAVLGTEPPATREAPLTRGHEAIVAPAKKVAATRVAAKKGLAKKVTAKKAVAKKTAAKTAAKAAPANKAPAKTPANRRAAR